MRVGCDRVCCVTVCVGGVRGTHAHALTGMEGCVTAHLTPLTPHHNTPPDTPTPPHPITCLPPLHH